MLKTTIHEELRRYAFSIRIQGFKKTICCPNSVHGPAINVSKVTNLSVDQDLTVKSTRVLSLGKHVQQGRLACEWRIGVTARQLYSGGRSMPRPFQITDHSLAEYKMRYVSDTRPYARMKIMY